jgi:PAS domain S-box-containing protein
MVTLRDFENPIQRKDGSIIWVSTNGIPVTNHLNEFVGYRGADINITERKLAEEELRKFRTISDQANYGTAIANLDGTLAYVNEAFAAMHGWEISELIGKSLAVLHTPEQMESVAPLLGLIQTQGGFSAEEVWRVKKDGTVFPSLMNTKLILDQNNQPQFMATSATDITELVKTNQELLIAKDKAEASDRLKTAFMQNISHEVRTPLNGILGFGAMLADPYLDAEEKQEFLPMFEFSSNRLIKTITDYMDISLIASGSMEMNKKEVKLNSELFELRSKYEALCLSKSIDLYFKIDETQNDFTLHIDPEFLKKILSHLLDNAVTFTKEGSIVVSHAINADSIVFFVRDTGVGIAQDALERVFESFMQEDISTTRGHEGSGLGLFIVKGLLNQLGGNIELESTKGEGTTVSITIPVEKKKPQPVIQEKVKPVDKFTSNKAILVAEDDHSNQFFIRVILKKQGFKVYTAFDGKEALDICRTNPEISLVLMDLKMPVMNGYEATPKIKALRKDINIIAVTSHAMSGDERLALKAGCDDYLSKPVKVDALMNKLKKFGFVSEK